MPGTDGELETGSGSVRPERQGVCSVRKTRKSRILHNNGERGLEVCVGLEIVITPGPCSRPYLWVFGIEVHKFSISSEILDSVFCTRSENCTVYGSITVLTFYTHLCTKTTDVQSFYVFF